MVNRIELGSEYNLCLTDLTVKENNIFDYISEFDNVHCFDSGRSAIRHISNALPDGTRVLLPEFICESVSNCFNRTQIVYYKLLTDFSIDIGDLLQKVSKENVVIFVMHYFGAVQNLEVLRSIREIADRNNSIIIEDTTHSIFSRKKTIGDYMVCSIRKWLPISGGGLLYYNHDKLGKLDYNYQNSVDNSRIYGMILKDLFLREGFDCNKKYRDIFCECERSLEKRVIYGISEFSRFISSCFDVEEIRRKRVQNYVYLKDKLAELGLAPAIGIEKDEIPFVLVLRVPERDKLRAFFIDHRIYCAVHWPFDGDRSEDRLFAQRNENELISLPIDQRYSEIHIDYLIEVLKKYGGDLQF